MKNVKKSLSNLLCIILIAFYICSFNCIGNIDINAENNENLENPDVFESIESKILKEEEYYADGEEESNVYLDIDKMYFLPDEDILVSSTYLCIASLLDNLSSQINGYDIALKCFDKLEEDVYPLDVLNYFLKH